MKATILEFDSVLGLFKTGFPEELETIPAEVEALVEERQRARKARDYQRADTLRAKIEQAGYIIEDTADGVRLRKR